MTNKIGYVTTKWFAQYIAKDTGTARAARARLRRCQTPAEALLISETHELNAQLREAVPKERIDAGRLALLAIVFSHLKLDSGKDRSSAKKAEDRKPPKLAHLMGRKVSKDGPRKLNELRFEALIRVARHGDLIAPMRRALSVLGKEIVCDSAELAQDLYYWTENTRTHWCFQYYDATSPETNPNPLPEESKQ